MKPLNDRVPIVELESNRLDRIEAGVLRAYRNLPPPQPSRLRAVGKLALPVFALAGVAAAFLAGRATSPATPHTERTLSVTTGADATELRVGDISLAFAPDTKATVREARGVVVELERGGVDCDVAPRHGRPSFQVRADDVEVTVVGTRFSVERADDVKVAVAHGRVRVASPRGETTLTDGESWSRSDTVTAAADRRPIPTPAPIANAAGAPATVPTSGPTPGPSTEPAIAPPTAPAVALTDRSPHPPTSSAGSPGSTKAKPGSTATHAPATAPVHKAAPLTSELRAISLAPILRLEGDQRDAAINAYASLVAGAASHTAAHALYSMAYVHHFELGEDSAALRALSAYEKRFPRGAHAESVLWLRIRILCARALDDSCRAAAHSFLRRFPDAAGKAAIATRIVNEM